MEENLMENLNLRKSGKFKENSETFEAFKSKLNKTSNKTPPLKTFPFHIKLPLPSSFNHSIQ